MGLVVTAAATCLLSQFSLRQHCAALGIRPQLSLAWSERRILWTFSVPAFLCGALVGPVTWAANAMLVHQPGGYGELGVFSAANQWRSAIAFIPGTLTQFALPLLSSLNGERDHVRYGRALRWNLILTAMTAGGVAMAVMICAPLIMRMYGSGFRQGTVVLVMSAFVAVVSCVNGVVGTAILSGGSVWVGFVFNALWAAVLLTCTYHLVPTYLALGLTVSMLCAYLAHTIWQAIYLRHRVSKIQAN